MDLSRPRYEHKYVITLDEFSRFQEETRGYLQDHPQWPNGYWVNSIYYDTDDFRFYFEKLDGIDRRHKVRVRWYQNQAPQSLFVEIKNRIGSRVFKERAQLPGKNWNVFFENRSFPLFLLEASSIRYTISSQPLSSKCQVSYFRKPMICPFHPNLRVTFDSTLHAGGGGLLPNYDTQSSAENKGNHPSDAENNYFLPRAYGILEIKFFHAMPLWLAEICREIQIQDRRYSKYCSAVERLYPGISHREVRMQPPPL